MNDKALHFFKKMAGDEKLTPNSVKLAKNSDFSALDAAFIRARATKESDLLDLGSGTGLIVNKLYPYVKSIMAVEPFPEFTKFIVQSENVSVVHADIFEFASGKQFDIITLFALMHYFDAEQAALIYKKYVPLLKPGGIMLIKNQFGVHEDVTVDGFSEELKTNYHAQYRHIDKEVALLESVGLGKIEVIDIYPPEHNRWENTHFYALVAKAG